MPPGGVPAPHQIGIMGGINILRVTDGGMSVVGGGLKGIAGGGVLIASNSLSCVCSIASSVGSSADTGVSGDSDSRFPHRVRASCSPSVINASPSAILNGRFVQNTLFPIRYETYTSRLVFARTV